MSPPSLLKSRSSFAPPDGKLSADSFDFEFKYESRCLWIVALDGSDLSFRALRLCAFLMNPKNLQRGQRDNVVVVNVLKPGDPDDKNDHLWGDAKNELIKCGVFLHNIACKSIQLPDGWEVGDALVYFANHAGVGHSCSAHLVLGAQGIDKQAGGKMAHVGSIATQCMAKVKVPITIVKNSWGTRDGERDGFGRPIRVGRDGNPKSGLHIMCCVDGSPTGDAAFDLATSLCREGDSLQAVHVTGFLAKRTLLAEQKYTLECEKVKETRKLQDCSFLKVPAVKGSVSDALVEASHDADLLVMGTIELANIKKRHILGSIAMGIAKHCDTHMTIIKNFAN